jgi:DNA (cytosine-5)-methyltransferase 1
MSIVPVIDLFAGPGGLGEGFSSVLDNNDRSIFNIALSIEKDPVAHQTLLLRSFYRKFASNKVPDEYYQYLRKEISSEDLFSRHPEEIAAARKEALHRTLGSGEDLNSEIDAKIQHITQEYGDKWALIGGPPCQAYSVVGRSRRSQIADYIPEKDDRNFLYEQYLRILAEHQPAVFVMENVKGMLSAKINGHSVFDKILADLQCPTGYKKNNSDCNGAEYEIYSLAIPFSGNDLNKKEYKPCDFVIKSELFGIPQARHRVILLGVKKGFSSKHPDVLRPEDPVSVKDVLGGLPALRSGLSKEKESGSRWLEVISEIYEHDWLAEDLKSKNSSFRDHFLATLSDLDTQKLSRGADFIKSKPALTNSTILDTWYLDHRIGGVCNHLTRAHMNSDLHRYFYSACFATFNEISAKLDDFPRQLMPNHKNASTGSFKDRFRVQLGDQPAKTITSHISKDGHYYIHYDPIQCRSLTVREAARLQTFPDNYFFEGNRTQQYHQVGNAVPPLLARKIAVVVRNIFREAEDL